MIPPPGYEEYRTGDVIYVTYVTPENNKPELWYFHEYKGMWRDKPQYIVDIYTINSPMKSIRIAGWSRHKTIGNGEDDLAFYRKVFGV
jgi:hypothetical protein